MRISDWSSDVCSSDLYNFITEDSKAVFGHVTYDLDALVDGLQFEAGIRYTKDKVRSCSGVGPTASGSDVEPGECVPGGGKLTNAAVTQSKSHATTWTLGQHGRASRRERGCQYV